MLKRSPFYKALFSSLLSSSLLALAVTSCACTDSRKPEAGNNDHEKTNEVAQVGNFQVAKNSVTKAVAEVKPYKDNKISGVITFTKVSDGIQIIGNVHGLKPGKHGFHVHEHGDCSGEDGMKAGGHFNPTHTKHGGPDSPERHVGDLGNLEADADGYAHYERVDKVIALEGENSILGRSIVIHADPDDFTTQPTGASGARIACGMIEAVEDRLSNPFNESNE